MILGPAVALVLVLAVTPAAAQTRATAGDVAGRILDPSGAVVPGVSVSASNSDTGLVRAGVTDAEGRFLIPALPPGIYTVMAELQGFTPRKVEGVLVTLGSFVELELTLAVAGLAEQVVVAGETPGADMHRTQISTTIDSEQITQLPINRRNFISFAAVTPGVALDRTPQQGASATSGLTFAGQRARSNNITVDGLDNNDVTVGAVRAVFGQEAVREFQVLTHSYSAEFGKASGGVVNIVTRSGTNTPSGVAFLFFRDESLNAKEHFERFNPAGDAIDRAKAPYGQKQFGGTFGGPLRKDRLFFFASFERLDVDTNNFVTIDDTAPVRHPFTGATLGTAADILRNAGFPVESGNVPYKIESNQLLAKIDQQLGRSGSVAFRYNMATALDENIEPFGGQVARSRAATLDSADHMAAMSHTAILSGLVSETRAQVAYRDQMVRSNDPVCAGPCEREDQGGPTLEVTGVASVGRQRFTPQPRANIRYQFLQTVSYSIGRHLFKAGADVNHIDNRRANLPLHFGGRYIFAPLPAIPGVLPAPVSAIQAVALGLPAAYVQGYGNSASSFPYTDLGLFLQDDWRPTPALTVKMGVRYQNQFWPDFVYTVPGYPESFRFPSDNNNVAPRLAVAWSPGETRRMTLRAAYGLFYDNHIAAAAPITDIVNGADGVRTLVQRFPGSLAAWHAPQRRLPEPAPGSYPSLVISLDPALKTPYAHHASFGGEWQMTSTLAASASFMYARGSHQLGSIDYNPLVPALGSGRRPADVNGVPGTSASVLQYTAFGETWYRGLALSLTGRYSAGQFLVAYTLSKAEDNSTDFHSAFLPQDNGRGRDPANPAGLPLGFEPGSERGPSLQDQRHRFVASGVWTLPAGLSAAAIVTIGSGRPYNILAGADLNGDGDGGSFPADRARSVPGDAASSILRNSGTLPWQATVDLRVGKRFPLGRRASVEGLFEVFNLFNRTNYTEINNVFGTGPFPDSPLPNFGQFEEAAPPFQIQLGARVAF